MSQDVWQAIRNHFDRALLQGKDEMPETFVSTGIVVRMPAIHGFQPDDVSAVHYLPHPNHILKALAVEAMTQ
jgi:hypothetical protein